MKTDVFIIHPTFPERDKIARCGRILHQGGLVVFPTETVYGIAANGDNPKAISRLRKVKERSAEKPFSVLVGHKEDVDRFSPNLPPAVYKLVDAFWPGPLTIIIPTGGAGKTVGVRMPDNIIAQYLIAEAQCPLAAPSANREGNPPPVTCDEALRDTRGLVEAAIDGGPTAVRRESTVVDMSLGRPRQVRPGALPYEDIERAVRRKNVLFICTGNSCRSVMAEYLLRKMVAERPDIDVTSAGTSVAISMGASADTIALLQREDVDARKHRSQPVTKTMINKADLIFVMTRAHRQQIVYLAPSAEKRVYLLREFARHSRADCESDLDIPDPIGKPFSQYQECFAIIKDGLHKIIDLL